MSAAPDLDAQRLEHRRLLRHLVNFPLRELRELWKIGAFVGMGMGPRALLEALIAHMNVDTLETFPSHVTLAGEIECSVRSVQTYVATLVELGILNEPRVLRARGVLHYELGPSAYAGVREYLATHKSTRPIPPEALDCIEELQRENAALRNIVGAGSREAAAVRIRCTTATIAGRPLQAASVAPEVNSRFKSEDPSSSSATRELARAEEKNFEILEADRSAARSALGELHARKHPTRPPRRAFDVDELELVARCSSTIAGDVVAKLEALRFAIAGAWHASNGPPSSRFIFGALEHFEQHVDAGARRARALERRPTSPPREAVARPIEPEERAELGDVLEQLEAIGMR